MEAWPIRVNWRNPLRDTYEFKTEIISSRSGKEQRRALRQVPRRNLEYLATTWGDRFRAMTRTLYWQQGIQIVMADELEAVKATAPMPAGSATIGVASAPGWAVAGRNAALLDGERVRARVIQGASPTSITFTEATVNAWPAGAKVAPGLVGRLDSEIQGALYTPGVLEMPVRFFVDPGSELMPDVGGAALLFNGREVWLRKGNWRDPRELTFGHDMQTVDYGRGRTITYVPVKFGYKRVAIDYIARSKVDARDIRNFFLRHMGQRGEFYMPTDQPDLGVSAVAGSQITIPGPETYYAYLEDKVHSSISILLKDGTRLYRNVVGRTIVGGVGGNTVLTLDGGVPALNTIKAFSWLHVWRLASDELTLEWLTDEVAQARLVFQTLESLPAEA